jgi:CHASE3 domain sensor protein
MRKTFRADNILLVVVKAKELHTMTEEEKTPDVEDIKIRLGEEVPLVDETVEHKAEVESIDIVAELRSLGKQFGDTISQAWQSEERHKMSRQVQEGVQSFAKEVDKAFTNLRESQVAQSEAEEIKSRVESGELKDKTKSGVAGGLRWFSDELAKLADQFTPVEKEPPAEEEEA